MKLVKKWLLPILTCLIVAGAAVLPPYLSQLRDARQLGQVHMETLEADALPAYEPPDLIDRLTLYARWSSGIETIPSFQSREEQYAETAEGVMWDALEQMAEGGVLPGYLWEGLELNSWSYIMLWTPESGIANQAPVTVWRINADFGDKARVGALLMNVDAESGFPLTFTIFHDDMVQWLPYEVDALQQRMDQYLALLGLGVELVKASGPKKNGGITLDYTITGTNIGYWAGHAVDMLSVEPVISTDSGDFSAASG